MKKARPRNDIIVKTKFRFVGSLIYQFSLFNISLYVSTFAPHYSCLPKASVCYYIHTISLRTTSLLSVSTLLSFCLSVSLYVSMFIWYQSCLLNVYPRVNAILVVSLSTFLRNLLVLSHCNRSVYRFSVLPYVTHTLTELVLSNNVSL